MAKLFEGAFGAVMLVVTFLLLALQVGAAISGIEHLLGWNVYVATAIATISVFLLGIFGSIAVSILGYIGATKEWGWEWWQAILLVAPGLIVVALTGTIGGLSSIVISAFRNRK